jgi:hypothetical protein
VWCVCVYVFPEDSWNKVENWVVQSKTYCLNSSGGLRSEIKLSAGLDPSKGKKRELVSSSHLDSGGL